jgi:hypothetical protein
MVYLNTDTPILRVHREYAQSGLRQWGGRVRCLGWSPYSPPHPKNLHEQEYFIF